MHLSNANNERELLSHHPSDDDRDPGPRKPKSSGFFGGLVAATRTNQTSNNKRSVPPPVSRQSGRRRQQHVDAEFIDLLAERLSLSSGQAAAAAEKSKGSRGTTTNSADQQFDLLNDSSVHLLLHDDEDEEEEAKGGGGSSGSSSSGSSGSFCSSDEEHEDQLIVVEDLVVGSKFARQLSKSHSVLVEGNSVVLLDSSSGGDHHHHLNHQAPPPLLIPRRPTVPGNEIPSVPESPTRFCFVDGTNQVSVRDTVLRYCDQTEPLRFGDVYSERVLRQCRKVGEGVYSEVFMYRQADESSDEGKAIVLKVIPIEGELIVNGEVQKKFDEILSEIIISKELSDLRYDPRNKTNGFVNVERVRCVRGKYPGYLVDLWELYDDNHGSDNDHPEVFGEEQLFIVLELENAGQDLEAFNFTNAVQGHSAFLQTVLTLAVAESKYEFEHRDLHWGNILLRHTDEREAHFVVNGKRFSVPTEGVQVTIIDYTLSRMLYKRNYLQFNDLAHDEDLFSATGDYQYEIYRLMRKRLGNVWSSFEPYTNVLWLHYVIDKLINGARYRLKQSKKHKGAIKDMIKLRDQVPDSKSAVDLAQLVVAAE